MAFDLASFGFTEPHVLRGLEYAQRCVSGEINVCRYVRLACERQLRDLERWRTDESWPYFFSEEKAGRVCDFFEQLPHTQGPLSFVREDGTWNNLTLEPWQCFCETTLYGWIRKDSKPERPVRRFARAYQEVARGNGKSFTLSGALLYSFAEGEQGVEAYSAAVDKGQAYKVFGEAVAMLAKKPELREALKLETTPAFGDDGTPPKVCFAIYQRPTNSKAEPLSREAKKTGDSKNVAFAAVDELHAHQTDEVMNVLDSGTGKRGGNELIRIITTAGFNRACVCLKKRDYLVKVLTGEAVAENFFGIIYTLDEPDKEWPDEECRAAGPGHKHPACVLRKVNPNFGVSVDPIDRAAKLQTAIDMPSERNGILTKELNVWCSADSTAFDMMAWDRCADPKLKEEDFKGWPCIEGLDLGSTDDIGARVKLFWQDLPSATKKDRLTGAPKTERHFTAFLTSYLPSAAVTAAKNAQYDGWVRSGHIQVTPGAALDYDYVQEDIKADRGKVKLLSVTYDPWHAQGLAQNLEKIGVVMIEIRPNVQNFSEPMKRLRDAILEGTFHHDGNPVFRWMFSNVVCHRDAKDNIYPNKSAPENKIDGAVATISAMHQALLAKESGGNVYERRGIRFV